MKPWQRLASRMLVDDRWLRLRADRVRTGGGVELEPFYVIDDADWVQVYAEDADGRVLLVRQFRYGANAVCSELPGGAVEEGEAPLAAAQRELLEETGMTAAHWRSLGSSYPNPARQSNRLHVFLAQGLQNAGPATPDAGEELASSFHAPADVFAMIDAGEFSQSLHIAAFLLAQRALARS